MKPDRAFMQHGVASLDATIQGACDVIAPVWPLDRFIAVNPLHGWSALPFLRAAERLQLLGGVSLFMRPSYYREAWEKGTIRAEHLECAGTELGSMLTADAWRTALEALRPGPVRRPLLSDILDSRRDLQHEPAWDDVIVRQISRFCAAWFDDSMSDWRLRKTEGLYADWKDRIAQEHGIALLMRDAGVLKRSARLPAQPTALIGDVLGKLALGPESSRDLLVSALLRINGWASWCAYLRWQSRLQGRDDSLLAELLAIRLAWEWILDDGTRDPSSAWQRWKAAWAGREHDDGRAPVLAVWQRALELAYQTPLGEALSRNGSARRPPAPDVQMAFCIDVRSEIIRRAIERRNPRIQTLGCAGFFGLPIAYQPLGTGTERPQLPGLFKPRYLVRDSTRSGPQDRALAERVRAGLSRRARTGPFRRMPVSAFTLVEALGLGFVAKLLASSVHYAAPAKRKPGAPTPRVKTQARLHPVLPETLALDERADLVAGILRTMSLTRDFAPLVVLVGHASRSTNNPHASALDCGACGGQSGEVNVRLLAALLNDPDLRAALRSRAINIPADTRFLPALHNTTTDELRLLDTDCLPQARGSVVAGLQDTLAEASARARAERAHRLGLGELAGRPGRLRGALQRRALDWSQTRPEWGLADNAALIVAPRARTLGIDLRGRAFLHEYECEHDAHGAILEAIMTGPMIVAAWINLQYYASTVDNKRFGSGNKVLHNVVGGSIGVFEGNGGDLRTGLPRQSLHDGRRWMHTPLRLSVYVEARREAMEDVLHKHSLVRNLVANDWVYLFRIDPATHGVERYCKGNWLATGGTTARQGGDEDGKAAA